MGARRVVDEAREVDDEIRACCVGPGKDLSSCNTFFAQTSDVYIFLASPCVRHRDLDAKTILDSPLSSNSLKSVH